MTASQDRRRRGPVPAAMIGPLAPYEPALRIEMTRVGYAASSIGEAARVMKRLSRWMDEQSLSMDGLTTVVVEEFMAERRLSCREAAVARRWTGAVARFLHGQGVLAEPDRMDATEVELLLAAFRDWLSGERGLAAESVRCYGNQAKKFLAQLPEPVEESLACLDAATVTGFVLDRATSAQRVWSAKALVTALRSLLRFLHVQGLIPAPLVGAVPGVAGWRLDTLPKILPAGQVQALLGAHDQSTPVGLRDHAVLVAIARLGLRGGEIAALRLADVEWRAGQIVVRGKGSRIERLPLPAEVGEALAGYVTDGRPRCVCGTLFVTARAPYRPLTPAAVRAIMSRACRRADLPRLGAHRLRHTLASDMLRAGAPLAEVGQVLRHRSQLSTATYAKVDHEKLRSLARPWPGGAR